MKKGVLLCSIFLSIFFLAPQSQLSSSPQRQQNREKVIQKKKEQTSATTETQASQRILTRKDLILRSRAQEDTVYWARLFKAYLTGTLTRIIPLQNGGCLAAIFNADPGPSWLTLSPKGLIEKQEIKFPCVDIHPTLDGGYIGCGGLSADGYDMWIAKYSATGQTEWSKLYGGQKFDNGNSIQQTSDGGYIALGQTKTFVHPDYIDPAYGFGQALWVLKLFPDGSIDWQRSYGGLPVDLTSEFTYTIKQTPDNGYIICANTTFFSINNDYNIWLIKLTPLGDVEWQKLYGGERNEWMAKSGPHVQVTSEGDIIVAADTTSPPGEVGKILVFRTNPQGNIKWQKIYGGAWRDSVSCIRLNEREGTLNLIGTSASFSTGNPELKMWFLKLSLDGDILIQFPIYLPWFYCYVAQTDEGYFVGGTSELNEFGAPPANIAIAKISLEGNIGPGDDMIIGFSNAMVWDTAFTPVDTTMVPLDTWSTVGGINVDRKTTNVKSILLCWNLNQPPTNLSHTYGINRGFYQGEVYNQITWEHNPLNTDYFIAYYNVYRRRATESYADFKYVKTIPANDFIFIETYLDFSEEYVYGVSSVSAEGDESPIAEAVRRAVRRD